MKKRMEFILKELDEKGSVNVRELSMSLGCSEVTIRKDIQRLEDRGLLIRNHGGAIKSDAQLSIPFSAENVYKASDKKKKIAAKAYEYINNHDSIILDNASTSYFLAKHIKEDPSKKLFVITNSLVVAGLLADVSHVNVFLLGGQVGGKMAATMGDITLRNLSECRANKAFISAHGINFDAGITSIDSPQMQVKKGILNVAKEIYLLVDSSKFDGGYALVVCPLSYITGIITDDDISEKNMKKAFEEGIKLDIV